MTDQVPLTLTQTEHETINRLLTGDHMLLASSVPRDAVHRMIHDAVHRFVRPVALAHRYHHVHPIISILGRLESPSQCEDCPPNLLADLGLRVVIDMRDHIVENVHEDLISLNYDFQLVRDCADAADAIESYFTDRDR